MDYKDTSVLEITKENKEKLKSDIKWSVNKINKCKIKHQSKILKALIIYVSAFDEKNKYTSFLESWAALETLLNTDQNDLLIKRSLALYTDDSKAYQKQVMESLRQYRNEYIHEGGDSLDPLIACFYIQTLIFNIIVNFNLKYSGFFKNIEDANLLLDNYVPGIKELKTKKRVIDRAIELKEKNTKR